MSYPQPGATYRHEPKFVERMKRAEGGEVVVGERPNNFRGPGLTGFKDALDVVWPEAIPGQKNTSRKHGDAIDYNSDDIMRSKMYDGPKWDI